MTDRQGTCTRGHAVPAGATVCTVCQVPIDTAAAVRPSSSLLPRRLKAKVAAVAIGLIAVEAVGLGAIFAFGPGAEQTPGGGTADISAASVAEATPQPVAVSVPMAATIAERAVTCATQDGATDATSRLPCSADGDFITLELCRPAGTAAVDVLRRAVDSTGAWKPWTDSSSSGESGTCPDGEAQYSVAFAATDQDLDGSEWRIVGRDDQGDSLWRSLLSVDAAPEGNE